MRYEYYSSVALVTSVVVYLLAMFAHAAEWAAARKVPAEARIGSSTQSEHELASVAAGSSAVTDLVEWPSTASPERDGTSPARGGTSAGRGGTSAGRGGTFPELVEGPIEPVDGSIRQRVEQFGRVGVALTVIGFLLSLGGVLMRALAAGRAPWGNMFEFTTTAMVFIVGVYLLMVARAGIRWLGLPITLLATVGNGLAVTVFYVAVAPLVPALHSVWFLIHIVAAAISGAAFNLGGLMSILYLIKKRAEDRGTVRGYLAWLPSTRRMDLLTYRFHAFAFPLWTFTVAAGSIWAEYAWGRYWGWDPKETWALVTWVIYACYLHARSTAGWRGSKAAMIAILGLASFWFNFVGINLLVSGLHSYAGV
jgi:cytochrome c-type biogenesis protein CcsB